MTLGSECQVSETAKVSAEELLTAIGEFTRRVYENKDHAIKEYAHQMQRRGLSSKRIKAGTKDLQAEYGEMLHAGIMGLLAKREEQNDKTDPLVYLDTARMEKKLFISEKEAEMQGGGGAGRLAVAGHFLQRLKSIAVTAEKIEEFAHDVEERTIGLSPNSSEGDCEKDKPEPVTFFDKAEDIVDDINGHQNSTYRRLERIASEFDCKETTPFIHRYSP